MNLTERYAAALHRVQTGVAFCISIGETLTSPKHMRTGLDGSKAEQEGLARLLIAKGVITEDEYHLAMVEAVEREAERYQAHVREVTGDDRITLG